MSHENPGYQFDRESDGSILVSRTNTKGGAKTAEAIGQLRDYKKIVGSNVNDSNAGFSIGPGRHAYSPDAAWALQPRIDALSSKDAKGFWPLSPDVAIEVTSDTDSFASTVKKIKTNVNRRTRHGVAIDPNTREIREIGAAPIRLRLDFDAIIDA